MIDHDGNIMHVYPGGIVTIAGAKKTMPASFSRPWQAKVPYPNPKCPYHKPEEREQALLTEVDTEGEQWFVIDSLYAPERPHRLIVPDHCWNDEKMRHLGGQEKIQAGIGMASGQFKRELPNDRSKLWGLSVQIGPLAAQNVPHCHYHLYKPALHEVIGRDARISEACYKTPIEKADIRKNCEVVVFDDRYGFSAITGGQYTGQLFMFPNREMDFGDWICVDNIVMLIHEIVELYAKKFRSVEGLIPDYRWEFEIFDGKINFGIFVPKLNNTGTIEDMAVMDRRRGFHLLWSHEETARYLRGD